MTIAQFESWSLILGIGGLIGYMMFIIYKLGKESRAGRFGYIALFLSLGLGMFGFIAKSVIAEVLSL